MPTVDEIRAALATATSWPWCTGRASVRHGGYRYVAPVDKDADAGWVIEPTGYIADEDATLIAAAPVWLAWLCDEVERLRGTRLTITNPPAAARPVRAQSEDGERGRRRLVNIVKILRKCVARPREVLATFEHGRIVSGWHSDSRLVPREQLFVVLGAEVDGDTDKWSQLHLQVGGLLHGVCTPYLLTLIPPRQTYELVLPVACWRPPGPTLEPGVVKLLGWIAADG